MSQEEHIEKFEDLCGSLFERSRLKKIVATVLDLESLGNARDLTALCTP